MKKYDNYKSTKIIWYPEIPEHWDYCKVKHLANTFAGGTPSTVVNSYWESGEIPWLPSGKLQNCEITTAEKFITEEGLNSSSTKWIKPNTVLIALTGATCANIGYLKFDACANQSVVAIDETTNKANSRFLYYMFLSMRSQILTHQTGGAQAGINDGDVKNLYLLKPSIEEQTSIATFLDYKTSLIDTTIEKKKRLIELLKEKRQAVINEAVTKGLNATAPMKDSGVEWLGEIPEHCSLVPLRYLYNKIGSGVTPKGGGDVYVDEGVTFIRSQNVHFDGLRLDDVVKIDIETHQKMNNSSVEFNDVLLNITGASIGRCCVVNIDEEMNVNQHVCIIRVNERIKPDFLNIVLQSNVGQTQIKLLTTGGNREGLTQEAVKNMSIPLPNIETQIQLLNFITEKMKFFDLIKNKIETAIEKLQTYRQSLISEAVTGKIDVRDWERNKIIK